MNASGASTYQSATAKSVQQPAQLPPFAGSAHAPERKVVAAPVASSGVQQPARMPPFLNQSSQLPPSPTVMPETETGEKIQAKLPPFVTLDGGKAGTAPAPTPAAGEPPSVGSMTSTQQSGTLPALQPPVNGSQPGLQMPASQSSSQSGLTSKDTSTNTPRETPSGTNILPGATQQPGIWQRK